MGAGKAELSAGLERNLALVNGYFAAQNALFWIPVFVLWFSRSLTAAEVLRLEAVYYSAVVVLEVPSGWMSDRLGRRWTLFCSGLGWAAGSALIGLGDGFAAFAAGQVMLAAGRAFASGTDSSLLYESLDALGRPLEMRDRLGRAGSWGFATLAVASLAGGAVGYVDLRGAYLLSVVGGLAAAGIALGFVEPPRTGDQPTPREQLAILRQAPRNPAVFRVLVLVVAMTVFVHIPYELQQPWLDRLLEDARTPVISGVFVALSFMSASVGSRMAEPIAQRLDPSGEAAFTRGMALGMALLAGVMGLMALGPTVWVAPFLAMRSFPTGFTQPLAEAEVHPHLPSSIRATWLSLQSLAGRLAFALVLLGVSAAIGETWSVDALRTILVPAASIAGLGTIATLAWRSPPR
ncbi:MAG: MFS transporter [Alphaproteobacteria bacterium]|nr:MFS transporter [Alphaproteobacteria bacterium]